MINTYNSFEQFDALVIGGGPAGSVCAITLAQQGFLVVIIEKTDMQRMKIGEYIDASIGTTLSQLGIHDSQWMDCAQRSTGVAIIWQQETPPIIHQGIFNPFGGSWRLNRKKFDEFLFGYASRSGVLCLKKARLKLANHIDGKWHCTISIDNNKESRKVVVDYVIEATGRANPEYLAPCKKRIYIDNLFAIAFRGDSPEFLKTTTLSEMLLLEATTQGWWYSTYLPGKQPLSVLLTDLDLLPKGKTALKQFFRSQLRAANLTNEHYSWVKEQINVGAWTGFNAHTGMRKTFMSNNWFVTGDALMSIDPLRGQGIPDAVDMGVKIAELLVNRPDKRDPKIVETAQNFNAMFNERIVERTEAYASQTLYTDNVFWARRKKVLTHYQQMKKQSLTKP